MSSRAILTHERASLAALVVLSLVGSGAEAGFLVLVTRTGIALSAGDQSIAVTGSIEVGLVQLLLAAGVLVTIRLLANLAGAAVTSHSLARAALRLRTDFTQTYLMSSWPLKQSLAPGRVQQLLSSYTQTAVTVVTAVARGLTAIASLVALIGIAFVVQPQMTVLAGVVLIVLGAAMLPLRRAVRSLAATAAQTQLRYAALANETESVALEIEVLGVARQSGDRMQTAAAEAATSLGRSNFAQLSIGPAYQFVAFGAILALLGLSSRTGFDDVGTVGVVVVLLLRALSYGQSLQIARAQFTNADVYTQTLDEELELLRSRPRVRGTARPATRTGIEADRLTFAYDVEPTLHDMNFAIADREVIGVVGPSGSGKSTLTQLLLGLRSADGRLMFDGIDVHAADPEWWSRNVALVPQHAELITGSVADNIRFLRDHIDDEAIEHAARVAAIHDDVMALPEGYDTHLGERGSRLSGGQRQRICIARALAGRPRFLVMDEPTSALDGASERRVLDALRDLEDRPTIVLITHRPAALGICDRVMGLDAGRIERFEPIVVPADRDEP